MKIEYKQTKSLFIQYYCNKMLLSGENNMKLQVSLCI